MADIFVMPDAERVVIDYLNAGLAEPVSLTIPNPRPAAFVTVQRVGGPRLNRVADNAMLTVEAWSSSPTAAKTLIERCRGLLHAMTGQTVDGVAVYAVREVSGPANLPDPDTTQARYTQTVTVAMRGHSETV